MELNEYQNRARETWNPGTSDAVEAQPVLYCGLALAGEAGEVANEMKKVLRNDFGEMTPERKEKIVEELGDCLWYIAMMADKMGVPLEEIGELTILKLKKRYG